jgi:hypothetical protein
MRRPRWRSPRASCSSGFPACSTICWPPSKNEKTMSEHRPRMRPFYYDPERFDTYPTKVLEGERSEYPVFVTR